MSTLTAAIWSKGSAYRKFKGTEEGKAMTTLQPVSVIDKAICAPGRVHSLQLGVAWFDRVPGGLNRVYADLIHALPLAGVDVTGAVIGPDNLLSLSQGKLHPFAPEGGSMAARLIGARRTISSLLAANRFDVVASHFALYTAPALDKIRRRPLVVHFHGPWAAESVQEGAGHWAARAKKEIERAVYARADRIIVLSEAFAKLASREYGIPNERFRLIPGTVNLDRFTTNISRREAREILGWPLDRPILFSVRRLVNRMGLDRLIQAMDRIAKQLPDALLYIGGKGPARRALETLVEESRLSERVRFLGYLPEEQLPLALRAASVNVVPTVALEGFGLTAAEGLASGTPSMVTPVGGLPEVVAGLSMNLIFHSSSAGDIAEGLIGALRGDISLPTEQACRAYAEEHFNADLAARRTAATYRELL
jgi:glycosyltransferase involved in cell wall biosynthesis